MHAAIAYIKQVIAGRFAVRRGPAEQVGDVAAQLGLRGSGCGQSCSPEMAYSHNLTTSASAEMGTGVLKTW